MIDVQPLLFIFEFLPAEAEAEEGLNGGFVYWVICGFGYLWIWLFVVPRLGICALVH